MYLGTIQKLTKICQSGNADVGPIAGLFWGLIVLLEVLEKAGKGLCYTGNKSGHLATCIYHSGRLFNKYYQSTDGSRVCVTAAVLDPSQYFCQIWNKNHQAEDGIHDCGLPKTV